MDELVTGDAVVLGLRPARLPTRALAVAIDLLLAWTVYVVVTLALLVATASLDDAALAAVQVGLFLLVLVGMPIAVETLSGGRSLGKLVAGLRVVRDDGGPVRFRHALVRGAVGAVEIQLSFGVVACAASLVSSRGRRLGDVFAGALVVRERVPVVRESALPVPPVEVAGRFEGLDLSRVPDGLWLAVRQYLMRAGQLDEAVARSMAGRLGEDLVAWTGVPAPEGMPAAVYLAGVVAERQARDARRVLPEDPAEEVEGPERGGARRGEAGGEDGFGGAVGGTDGGPGDGPGGGPERASRPTGFVPPA